MESSLARGSQVVLKMRVDREADKFDSQGTTSFVVLSAIFDGLQAALIEKTDFRNEQFAKIHPAGAVGKKLNS
jgi:D-arabinose 5-phosphate isomerase GutQ